MQESENMFEIIVIDISEHPIERPKKSGIIIPAKEATYPEIQVLVCKKTGLIENVRVDKGRKHDFRIYKESRLAIAGNTIIQADDVYQGIQKYHSNSVIPHKGRKKKPLSKEQKRENHKLSSSRVIVENVIRTIKYSKSYRKDIEIGERDLR